MDVIFSKTFFKIVWLDLEKRMKVTIVLSLLALVGFAAAGKGLTYVFNTQRFKKNNFIKN